MKFIDAHTHAHFAAFKDDSREVIERAINANVVVVNVGTQKDTSKKAVEVANSFAGDVYAVVGLHPIHTGKSFHDEEELGGGENAKTFTSRGEDFDFEYYKNLALDPKILAIGECGLDYFRIENEELGIKSIEEIKERQTRAFLEQIKLAYEVKKPLMIHCREAYADTIKILKENSSILNSPAGIFHFYSGSMDDTKEITQMGFYFTFGGVITFSRDYDERIKLIPMDKILSETDAPYVAPVPYRGKRNEPVYVAEVVKKLAEIKRVSFEEMADQIWKNAKKVFGI
jgi:TatD DNase family protein